KPGGTTSRINRATGCGLRRPSTSCPVPSTVPSSVKRSPQQPLLPQQHLGSALHSSPGRPISSGRPATKQTTTGSSKDTSRSTGRVSAPPSTRGQAPLTGAQIPGKGQPAVEAQPQVRGKKRTSDEPENQTNKRRRS
ncbi:hypothetical protein CORC01_05201, partial [Colletotrichum orchidophilum]